MPEVLDLEKIETEKNRELGKPIKDTWILKLPDDVCDREGLAKGTMISLTIKDHGIQTSFIKPNPKLKKISDRLKKENNFKEAK